VCEYGGEVWRGGMELGVDLLGEGGGDAGGRDVRCDAVGGREGGREGGGGGGGADGLGYVFSLERGEEEEWGARS